MLPINFCARLRKLAAEIMLNPAPTDQIKSPRRAFYMPNDIGFPWSHKVSFKLTF
jgi:hypothetical protein